jgi:hypothetical protein
MAGERATTEQSEALDERVGVLAAQIHALTAQLVDTLAELDRVDGWGGHGFRSFAHWLSVRAGFVPSEAQRLTRLATRVDRVPTLMADARRGLVSAAMCGLAARLSTPDNESAIAEIVRLCTPSQAMRVLGQYRRLDPGATTPGGGEGAAPPTGSDPDAEAEELEARREEYWSASFDDDGMYSGSFRLAPLRGELLRQAMEASRRSGERASAAEERAARGDERASRTDDRHGDRHGDRRDAADRGHDRADDTDRAARLSPPEVVERMARMAIDEAERSGARAPRGERFLVHVTLDVAVLARIVGIVLDPMIPTPVRLGDRCHIVGGPTLSDAEAAIALCEAEVQVLVEDAGVPLWLGNDVRLASRQQRRALRSRSGGCQFPGCRQTRHVQAHHVVFHGANGSSGLDNFVLLCTFHHHRLHEGVFSVVALGRQSFEFRNRWGRVIGPPGLEPCADPAAGTPPDIEPDTPRSIGRGEPLTEFGLDVLLHGLLELSRSSAPSRAAPAAA